MFQFLNVGTALFQNLNEGATMFQFLNVGTALVQNLNEGAAHNLL